MQSSTVFVATSLSFRERIAAYRELSKSGIVFLVLVSVLGGYLAAHPLERSIDWGRLFFTLLFVMSLSSGSSALNQIQEHQQDLMMPRTRNRPLPSGRITLQGAWIFSGVALLIGAIGLYFVEPALAFWGILAVISYNVIYTLGFKPRHPYAAIPGAIPGAIPALMGAVASTQAFLPLAGIYLFSILFFWQMPHFWALAIRYREDYAKGGFPTLPTQLGVTVTHQEILIWTLGYMGLLALAPWFLNTSWIASFLSVMVVSGITFELYRFLKSDHEKAWLRFFLWINFSLIAVLTVFAIDQWIFELLVPVVKRFGLWGIPL